MIQAKPVIPDQYWILRDQGRKIGNIEAEPGGYAINLNGQVTRVKTLTMLADRMPIDFQAPTLTAVPENKNEVHGYPTTSTPHNAVFDVKHQLPLWTQKARSRSWVTAGWYRVKQHRDWKVMLCPKLILLERYSYQGPFKTQAEARSQ